MLTTDLTQKTTSSLKKRSFPSILQIEISIDGFPVMHQYDVSLHVAFQRASLRTVRTFVQWWFTAFVIQVAAETAFEFVPFTTVVRTRMIKQRLIRTFN